jgi:hypothetical protein
MAQEEELVFDGCVVHFESLVPKAAVVLHPACFYKHYLQHPGLHESSKRPHLTFNSFQIQFSGRSHILVLWKIHDGDETKILSLFVVPSSMSCFSSLFLFLQWFSSSSPCGF